MNKNRNIKNPHNSVFSSIKIASFTNIDKMKNYPKYSDSFLVGVIGLEPMTLCL